MDSKGKGLGDHGAGLTRILKGLLAKQFPGESCYKVAAPAVHILTGMPDLGTHARCARLSLLISMCRAAPALLWAVLRHDGSWIQAARDDLAWLSADGTHWPGLRAVGWPAWHHLLTGSGPYG